MTLGKHRLDIAQCMFIIRPRVVLIITLKTSIFINVLNTFFVGYVNVKGTFELEFSKHYGKVTFEYSLNILKRENILKMLQ